MKYTIKQAPEMEFKDKSEFISFLKENKNDLKKCKKLELKHTDAISFSTPISHSEKSIHGNKNKIKVKVVMNTTKIMDSHSDVHLNNLWNKSISDNTSFYHLKEHERTFDAVISDNSKASVQEMLWKDLGVDAVGTTQALIFESEISKERNEFMFNQYAKGYVKNHSVGMQYVKIELAIYDEEDEKELDFWNKHINEIVNKEEAEQQGYFWVVSEAKLLEGSAVLFGSNRITPTLEIKDEPSKDTRKTIEPSVDTQKQLNDFITLLKI